MKKRGFTWIVLCLALLMLMPVTAQAAWKTTTKGKMYTTTGSPGYYVGWQKIDGAKYYFSTSGIMATGWQTIDGSVYYFGTNGKMRTSWRTIDGNVYYFGTNGKMRTGWRTIKKLKYYFNSKGVMLTGLQTIKNKMYYFNSSGVRQYGFIKVDGKVYYSDKNTGVLAQDTWVGDYYFQKDGTMAVNQWINGKWVGADGRYTGVMNNVGWITDNGITCYYDRNSQKVYGWLTLSGKKYYLNATTGALQYGWFKVGNYSYYADKEGVIQVSTWVDGKYLKSTGAMATGWTEISGKNYYFSSTGVMATGWKKISSKYYYFDTNGVRQESTWIDDKYYVGSNGVRASGVTKIGTKYYYFSQNTGELLKGWIKSGSDLYYAHKTAGYLYRSKWFTKSSYKYYAGSDCKIYTGLKTISGTLYFFSVTNGRMEKSVMKKVGTATYYFSATGAAVTSKWVKYKSKYYYFEADGKMAVSKWVGKYYVGSDGARTSKTLAVGLNTISGKIYYYDSKAVMQTGWQTVSGNKYYFGTDGAAVTGLQMIDSKKYYFYSTGILAVNLTLAVGNKEYTINADGVITAEKSISISGTNTGAKIAKYAIKYIGNPYVYGGTSLTQGADCSGFVQTVFAYFGIKLPRVADDQMKGATGYQTPVVVTEEDLQPGDLIFYGAANYASHVAIYIGDGNIVHASNSQPYPAGGIKISQYNYATPIKIIRYWT